MIAFLFKAWLLWVFVFPLALFLFIGAGVLLFYSVSAVVDWLARRFRQ